MMSGSNLLLFFQKGTKKSSYYQKVKGILGSSIIGYWPLWEPSGNVAIDISGNNRNGLYTGAKLLGSVGIGDNRTSCNFNAVGEVDAFSSSLASVFNPNSGGFCWWAKSNLGSIYQDSNTYNFCYWGASLTYYYIARKNTDETITFISRRGATVKQIIINVPTTPRWTHYAMKWDTSINNFTGYINGMKQIPQTSLDIWSGTMASSFARIGDTSPSAGNTNWPGSMAHNVLLNSSPTDGQIRGASLQIGNVIFDGDSRTIQKIWANEATELAFPNGNFAYGKRGLGVWAVSGATMVNRLANVSEIVSLFGKGINLVILWAGVNDAASQTAQQIYNNIVAYAQAVHTAGGRIIICSEIDSQVNMTWHTTIYPALNTLLNANHSFADGYINLGADPRLQNALDTTYFNADKLHLTPTGYDVVRDLAYPEIARVGA